MISGQDGLLFLSRTTLPFATLCRFIPAHPARPCPTFGRPVHRRGGPHRLRPGTSPHALRIPPHNGHPALRRTAGWWLQVRLGLFPAFAFVPVWTSPYLPPSPANEELPPLLDTAPLIRAPEGLEPSRSTRCSAHTVATSDSLPGFVPALSGSPLMRFSTGRSCLRRTEQGLSGKLDVLSRRATVLYTVPATRIASRCTPSRSRLRL